MILNPYYDCAPTKLDSFDFAIEINKLNCDRILPKLSKYHCKDDLEGFLILEHMNMSRQFRVTSTLLENIRILNFDTVDYCLIVASQVRSLIENIAVVNFLIHDIDFSKEDKISEITNFRNQYRDLAITKEISTSSTALFNEFIRDKHKSINKHIWAKLSPDNRTLSKLIKLIKVPDGESRINGIMLFEHWDDLFKLLHNNQLFRLVYWKQDELSIHLNFDMFKDILEISLMSLTNIFLRASLYDLVDVLKDGEIAAEYEKIEQEITTKFYNKKVGKLE